MYARILTALDGSASSERIVPWVRMIAQGCGSRVTLLRVCPPQSAVIVSGRTVAYVNQLEDEARTEAFRYLQAVGARLPEGVAVSYEIRFGEPVAAILDVARERGVDLIALATRGLTGLGRLLTRSVTTAVLRQAPVPVLVARFRDQRAA